MWHKVESVGTLGRTSKMLFESSLRHVLVDQRQVLSINAVADHRNQIPVMHPRQMLGLQRSGINKMPRMIEAGRQQITTSVTNSSDDV